MNELLHLRATLTTTIKSVSICCMRHMMRLTTRLAKLDEVVARNWPRQKGSGGDSTTALQHQIGEGCQVKGVGTKANNDCRTMMNRASSTPVHTRSNIKITSQSLNDWIEIYSTQT
jgi:hypothetical protein